MVETIQKNESSLDQLYKEYENTGEASDKFKDALLNQAEALGINDAAILTSKGKYEELKKEIDEATEAVYLSNIALNQEKIDNTSTRDVAKNLSEFSEKICERTDKYPHNLICCL